jgi:flagellar hook assembly protein FlgD
MTVYDINQQILNVADPVVSLSMKYTDNNSDGYLDNTLVKKENLNVGYLDAAKNQWEISKSLAALNDSNKSISVTLNSIGLVTMLAATNPTSAISSVINYPNPFAAGKQSTRIRYVLIKDDDVTTSIYTLIGGLVLRKTYSSGTEGAKGQVSGYTNEITWDGKNDSGQIVANGMYILEIKTGSERFIRKIGVVK